MVWKMVGFIQTKKNGWLYACVFVYLWIMKPFKIAYSRAGSVHSVWFFVKTETELKLLFGSIFFNFSQFSPILVQFFRFSYGV